MYMILRREQAPVLPFCRGFLCDFAERSRPFPTVCRGGFPCPPVNMYMILRREQAPALPFCRGFLCDFAERSRPFPTARRGGFPCPPVNMYMILRRGRASALPFCRGFLCDFAERSRPFPTVCRGDSRIARINMVNGHLPQSRFRSTAPSMREQIRFPYYYAVLISSARNRRWRRVCADSVYQAIPAAWAANRGAFAKRATP